MKSLVAIIGIILLLLCLSLGYTLRTGESRALALDKKKTVFAEVSGDAPFCAWDVSFDEHVLAEDKSKAIVITTSNPDTKECQSTISMRAPGFDASPNKDEQNIKLPSHGKGSLSWIITPRKTGTYEIALSDFINTKIFGITVTNTFGLSSIQAKTFSFIGSIFGPMLTIPWWFERFRKPKPKMDTPKDGATV